MVAGTEDEAVGEAEGVGVVCRILGGATWITDTESSDVWACIQIRVISY